MTDQARRAGRPPDERRRLVGSLATAGVIITIGVAALAVSVGGAPGGAKEPGPLEPGWIRLPDPPLSPRQSATAVSVGGIVLVVGGDDAPPCPPNADCAAPSKPLADGARYDPAGGTWAQIAPAPVPIGFAEVAVAGDRAYVWIPPAAGGPGPTFVSYDVSDDAWTVIELPPVVPVASVRLVATADAVLAYPGSHEQGDRVDQVFDVATAAWRNLPPDPLGLSFDRSFVVVNDRIVSISVELVPNPGQRPPVYRAAVLELATGAWRRLADAPIVGSDPIWFVAGNRVINPTLGGADGGQVNNWGRTFPFGGMLDLEGEAWVVLRQPAPEGGSFGGPAAAGTEFIINRQGWALNVEELVWTPVGAPDGGPESGAAAAWADGHLVLFGGVRFAGNAGTLIGSAWEWQPAGS